MRSTSSSVNLQKLLRSQFNINVEAEQYTGTYYGVVQQTDFSVAGQANTNAPAPIPRGQMTFTIPSLSPSMVWGPIPYPGVENPPIGTITTITFDNRKPAKI